MMTEKAATSPVIISAVCDSSIISADTLMAPPQMALNPRAQKEKYEKP